MICSTTSSSLTLHCNPKKYKRDELWRVVAVHEGIPGSDIGLGNWVSKKLVARFALALSGLVISTGAFLAQRRRGQVSCQNSIVCMPLLRSGAAVQHPVREKYQKIT
jgi:hypothetical protein